MKIAALILDVDGVLTDGRLVYGPHGEAVKVFHVHDGSAIKRWRDHGRRMAWISGRNSPMVTARARELGIDAVHQGIAEKLPIFQRQLDAWSLEAAAVAYLGDDVPDLAPMAACGYPMAVANAVAAVRTAARHVTHLCGGCGAVREAIEHLLQQDSS